MTKPTNKKENVSTSSQTADKSRSAFEKRKFTSEDYLSFIKTTNKVYIINTFTRLIGSILHNSLLDLALKSLNSNLHFNFRVMKNLEILKEILKTLGLGISYFLVESRQDTAFSTP